MTGRNKANTFLAKRFYHSNSNSTNRSSSSSSGDHSDGSGEKQFSHVDENNQATMVDISDKIITQRIATAQATVYLPSEIAKLLRSKSGGSAITTGSEIHTKKGPVFTTAIIAGTQAVKKTAELIPFCHPLLIDSIKFSLSIEESNSAGCNVIIECSVKITGRTGVEMESLTGCSVAALTLYDMCKVISHDIIIKEIKLLQKSVENCSTTYG
jgi:cyclic pyranopterin phosphate synthase